MDSVMKAFTSYGVFRDQFSKGQEADDPVDVFKRVRTLNSGISQLMTDFLYDMMSGVYDEKMKASRAAALGKSATPGTVTDFVSNAHSAAPVAQERRDTCG